MVLCVCVLGMMTVTMMIMIMCMMIASVASWIAPHTCHKHHHPMPSLTNTHTPNTTPTDCVTAGPPPEFSATVTSCCPQPSSALCSACKSCMSGAVGPLTSALGSVTPGKLVCNVGNGDAVWGTAVWVATCSCCSRWEASCLSPSLGETPPCIAKARDVMGFMAGGGRERSGSEQGALACRVLMRAALVCVRGECM